MGRIIFELSGFFLLPFLCYAGFLMWVHKHPKAAKQIFKSKALVIQSLIGLALVAVVLLLIGFVEVPHQGGYAPAVFKDGKLIPGRVE